MVAPDNAEMLATVNVYPSLEVAILPEPTVVRNFPAPYVSAVGAELIVNPEPNPQEAPKVVLNAFCPEVLITVKMPLPYAILDHVEDKGSVVLVHDTPLFLLTYAVAVPVATATQ